MDELWNDFKSVFCNSKFIEEEIEKETEVLSNAIIHINNYIPSDR